MIVTPGLETQSLLDSIYAASSEGIGSNKFMNAYCINLERLSIQAHLTAGVISATQSILVGTASSIAYSSSFEGLPNSTPTEYIVEAFLENADKLEDLIKTLLALEYWRENILFRKDEGIQGEGEEEEDAVEFEVEGGERGVLDAYESCLNNVDEGEEVPTKGLAPLLAANGNSLRAAFVLHAETTIVSMLNLVFFKGIPPTFLEGDGDQFLLSLVDYCARQLAFLGTPVFANAALHRQKSPLSATDLSTYLTTRSRLDEIQDSLHDESYKTAVAAVSLSRYLCENAKDLPASIVSRMMEVHDWPLLMVPLIEEPPWTRRRQVVVVEQKEDDDCTSSTRIVWEKLNDNNEWSEVLPRELLVLTKAEAQPWLALFHLTACNVCRESYGLDEFRKAQLMRLRRYINEALTDQLPVLQEVARYLDELSILGVPAVGGGVHRPSSNASSSGLLLQRVDSLRESIIGRKNIHDDDHLDGIVKHQWDTIYSHVTDANDEELKRLALEVYDGPGSDDFGEYSN